MKKTPQQTNLNGKNIIVGITGGIAVYKVCDLVRSFMKLGANVTCVMTESATKFVTPMTFQSLTKNRVCCDMFDDSYFEIEHVSLAQKADIYVIVPATANTIAKLALGFADNLVTSTAIATTAPIIVCPAMNHNMYHHKAVEKNIKILKDLGYKIVDAKPGLLACGVVGDGCLADNETIVSAVEKQLK
ncbi:MAG: hypothetical protein II816_07180 [Elusimicrobia bacterium]|nr:hypothetical protein [Elusimicrobiota bacterium]